MFENLLPKHEKNQYSTVPQLTAKVNYGKLAEITEGYSGADIRLVCKEAAMNSMRKVFSILEDGGSSNSKLSYIC